MSAVSVIIPYRPSDLTRQRAYAWIKARFEAHHPSWQVVWADCSGDTWNKAEAVNRAALLAEGEILVISDADLFVTRKQLDAAVALVRSGRAPWAMPFNRVCRLTLGGTTRMYALPPDDASPIPGGAIEETQTYCVGGGMPVVSREGFDYVNGMDERFNGWGGEDRAFGWALDKLVGEHVVLDAPSYHLWHTIADKSTYASPRTDNSILAKRYRLASQERSGKTMLELVHEQAEGTVP